MTDWLLSGTTENWERAIAESIWGVRERLRGSWDRLAKGDLLFFYATSPAKGIVGIGRVTTKIKQDKPLWKEEIDTSKVIWPYRFEFTTLYVLLRPDWNQRSIKLSEVSMAPRRAMAGITQLHSDSETVAILELVDEKWSFSLKEKPEKPKTLHEQMIEKLVEIGRFDGFIAEREYLIPDIKERMDVVWRRVPASVPTFVFEVQIGGNLHQALTKLKHAYDIWNSNPYLILQSAEKEKAESLLTGAFHQIQGKVVIMTTEEASQLYESQKNDDELKRKYGLRI